MPRAWSIAAGAVLAVAPGFAGSGVVYRCVGGDRVPGFQDHPCAAGQSQRVLRMEEAAPSAPPTAPAAVPAGADASVPAAAEPAVPDSRPAPPSFYLCTRSDGSRYVTEDGIGNREAVPFGMLGGSGQDLAEAYGGPNGIGVSAPGLRPIPDLPASRAPLAGAYVWVDDPCHRAGPQEACAYLRAQADDIAHKLRRAFSDTEAQLKQEQATLRERLSGC